MGVKKRTGLVFMPLLILSVMSLCGRKQDGSIMVIPIRETNDEVTLTIEREIHYMSRTYALLPKVRKPITMCPLT